MFSIIWRFNGVKKMSKIMDEFAKDIAFRASIRTAIATYRECNIDDPNIIERIMERFELSKEVATGYVNEKYSA
jgi:hypothetical protein